MDVGALPYLRWSALQQLVIVAYNQWTVVFARCSGNLTISTAKIKIG